MAANTRIANILTKANIQLVEARTQIAALQSTECSGRGGRGVNGGPGVNEGRGGRGYVRTARVYSNRNYCHTHGYDMHDDHTSVTCNIKAEGHLDDATFNNKMGGSQKNRTLVV